MGKKRSAAPQPSDMGMVGIPVGSIMTPQFPSCVTKHTMKQKADGKGLIAVRYEEDPYEEARKRGKRLLTSDHHA
jgi:hypothetical protein